MRQSRDIFGGTKFYGIIVQIKNKITLFTLLAKNPHTVYTPSKYSIPFFQNIVYILLY